MRLFPLSSSGDVAFFDPHLVFFQPTAVSGKTCSIQWNLDQGLYETSDVANVNECCYWLIFFCSSSTGWLVWFLQKENDRNSDLHFLCSIDDDENLCI